ncbi:MAG: hypothetical protein AAFO84_06930 [Cyanobacteria bacterium J06598_1]
MTYMPDTNLSTSTMETEPSFAEKLKTLKTEGTERSQRILLILRQAFSETREEFQAGRTVISPLAKEVTTEAVSTVKEKSQQAADAVNQAWRDEADAPDTTERLISLIKSLAQTAQTTLYPQAEKQAKRQAIKLDNLLAKRYGEQYKTLKTRFDLVRSWVSAQNNTPDSTMPDSTMPTEAEPVTIIEVDSEIVQ